jgi:hypothetical protein
MGFEERSAWLKRNYFAVLAEKEARRRQPAAAAAGSPGCIPAVFAASAVERSPSRSDGGELDDGREGSPVPAAAQR